MSGGERAGRWPWIKAVLASDLSSSERLLCLVLSTHMKADGTGCRPGVPTLAAEMGPSRGKPTTARTVQRVIRSAERRGWLAVRRSKGGTDAEGRGIANTYLPTIPIRAANPDAGVGANPDGEVAVETPPNPDNRPPPTPTTEASNPDAGVTRDVVETSLDVSETERDDVLGSAATGPSGPAVAAFVSGIGHPDEPNPNGSPKEHHSPSDEAQLRHYRRLITQTRERGSLSPRQQDDVREWEAQVDRLALVLEGTPPPLRISVADAVFALDVVRQLDVVG
jgi:hypothetical protein